MPPPPLRSGSAAPVRRLRAGRRGALAFLLLLLTAARADAQPAADTSRYVRRHWTTADGLPVNGLTDVLQGRDGYLWIASWDGLVRFDGLHFTVYNRANTPGLPGNRLLDLVEDGSGTLWIRTEQNRLAAFRRGRATPMGTAQGLIGDEVRLLHRESGGDLVVATEQGLFAWNGARFDLLWRFATARSGPRMRPGFYPTLMQGDHQKVLWIATHEDGLLRYERGRVQQWTEAEGAPLATVISMGKDRRGRLWIHTQRSGEAGPEALAEGVFVLDGTLLRNTRSQTTCAAPDAVAGPGATCLMTHDGLAFDGNGFILGDPIGQTEGQAWFAAGDDLVRADGLRLHLPRRILGATLDREANLWAATDAGLFRLRRSPFEAYGLAEGLPYVNLYPLLADHSGALWSATFSYGLLRFTPGRDATVHQAGFPLNVSTTAIYEDRAGTLWAGTALGACRMPSAAPPGTTCTPVSVGGLPRNPVYAIYQDRAGGMWFGGDRRLFRLAAGLWTSVPLQIPADAGPRPVAHIVRVQTNRDLPQPESRVRAVAEDRHGTLWFGSSTGGVWAVMPDPARGFDAPTLHHIGTNEGLPSNNVRDLYGDGDLVWVVTEDAGLARLDLREGRTPAQARLTTAQKKDGLPDDALHSLRPDGRGFFWISSNRGLFRLRRADLMAFLDGQAEAFHTTVYTERDGLVNREFNGGYYPSSATSPDGRLWFPAQAGLVAVDPARVAQSRPPGVAVERVEGEGFSLPGDTAVVLSPRQRTFEVAYTALTFTAPEEARFRYRLEGYDDDWVEAGERRTAYYTGVPPGRYTFHVQAMDKEGTWNVAGASTRITVRPFFFETWWFLALCALGVAGVIYAGFRERVRRLQGRQQQLEDEVVARTRQVVEEKRRTEHALETVAEQAAQLRTLDAAKNRFFANISHEFRTPLTLILGPVRQVLDGRAGEIRPPARDLLALTERNARRLQRLINELLDLARLDAGGLVLRVHRGDLAAVVRRTVALFESTAAMRGVLLRAEAPEEGVPFGFDVEKVEHMLLNLLSNAFKFTPDGGTITVRVTRPDDEAAQIEVADTGEGIPAEHLPHLFDRFYQVDGSATRRREGSGIGLALVKELVALHGGTIRVASTLGRGTTFTILLPDVPVTEADTSGDGQAPEERPEQVPEFRLPFLDAPEISALDEAPRTVPDSAEDAAPRAERPLVLVVEDNADLRAYLRGHLADSYEVADAADGRAGLEQARALVPDLVLSDVMMPEMDGLELCRHLKTEEATSHIPVVLLTARADVPSRIEGLDTGADDYLAKPFEPTELRARVRNLIENRRRMQARLAHDVLTPAINPALPTLPPREVAFVQEVLAVVEAHLSDVDFGVEALAEAVHLGRRQLTRKLLALTGEAPSDLLRRIRMTRAAGLLRDENLSIKEAADAVGFRSVPHFAEAFRETFGTTPAAYRAEGTA